MSCTMCTYLGAYVLDALEPDEAAAVDAHLRACAPCRDEVWSLAGTASHLAVLSLDDVTEMFDPDEPEPVGERRGRAVRLTAGALVVAAAAVGGLAMLADGPGSAGPPAIVRATDAATHVGASITLTAEDRGTRLHLSLRGAYPHGSCYLIAHARDGRTDTAASWVAGKWGAAEVSGRTSIPASQLSEFDVVTKTGRQLVRIAVPHTDN